MSFANLSLGEGPLFLMGYLTGSENFATSEQVSVVDLCL